MPVEVDIKHYRGERIGRIEWTAADGARAPGGGEFVLGFRVFLGPPSAGWIRVVDASARLILKLRKGPYVLGQATATHGVDWSCQPGSREDDHSLVLGIVLPAEALRAIERERLLPSEPATIDVDAWMNLRGACDRGPVALACHLVIPVPATQWRQALRSMAWESTHVIEVPTEGGRVGTTLANAAEHYRRALEQYDKGSWVQVVGECRKVVEDLRDTLQLQPRSLGGAPLANLTQMMLRERIEVARAAIHHITHLAHHPGVSDDPDIAEARLALGLAGVLLRYYAER